MTGLSPFFLALTLFISVFTVHAVTRVFTFDDGQGSEEHCCLVRVQEQVCVATPVTRSLLQVNKQCPALGDGKQRRLKKKKNRDQLYLDRISRRLDVKSVREQTDHILIELETPLERAIVNRDLVCLASAEKRLNLDRCFIRLANPLENDRFDEKTTVRKYKHRRQHRSKEAPEAPSTFLNTTENEANRVEVGRSVHVREGEGLSIRQTYRWNPNAIRPTNRFERQCWSWFRRQSKKSERNPAKSCLHLNDHRDRCVHLLVHEKFDQADQNLDPSVSLTTGSRLFCENHGHDKLIGHLGHSTVCFQEKNQIVVEHLFHDLANISDLKKNKEILQFISEESKLKAEFEDDCHDRTTLVEQNEPETEMRSRSRSKTVSNKTKQ